MVNLSLENGMNGISQCMSVQLGSHHARCSPRRDACFEVKAGTMTMKHEVKAGARRNVNGSTTFPRVSHSSFPKPSAIPSAWITTNFAFSPQFRPSTAAKEPNTKFFNHAGKTYRWDGYIAGTPQSQPRYVGINYYLQDDTLAVYERRGVENGMGGKLVKRSKVPKWDEKNATVGNDLVTPLDIVVGQDLVLYGTRIHVYDCDAYTRESLPWQPFAQPAPISVSHTNGVGRRGRHHQRSSPGTDQSSIVSDEYSLTDWMPDDSYGESDESLQYYLRWDDSSSEFGYLRYFVLRYFLCDGTIIMRELLDAKGGHHFSSLCPITIKRGVAAKSFRPNTGVDWIGHPSGKVAQEEGQVIGPRDLVVGEHIILQGQSMLICGCSESTHRFWERTMGTTMRGKEIALNEFRERVDKSRRTPKPPMRPATTGSSTHNTMGRFLKASANVGTILRFIAQPTSSFSTPSNRDRVFLICWFPSDSSLSAYVRVADNDKLGLGLEEGNHTARTSTLTNPNTGRPFTLEDFRIGSILHLPSVSVQIFAADAFSMDYLLLHEPQYWSVAALIKNLKRAALECGTEDPANAVLEVLSGQSADVISPEEVNRALKLSADCSAPSGPFDAHVRYVLQQRLGFGEKKAGMRRQTLASAFDVCGRDDTEDNGAIDKVPHHERIRRLAAQAHSVQLTGFEEKALLDALQRLQLTLFGSTCERAEFASACARLGLTDNEPVNISAMRDLLMTLSIPPHATDILWRKFSSVNVNGAVMTAGVWFEIIRQFLTAKARGEVLGLSHIEPKNRF